MMVKLHNLIVGFMLFLSGAAMAGEVESLTPAGVLHLKNKSFDDSDKARRQILDLFQESGTWALYHDDFHLL